MLQADEETLLRRRDSAPDAAALTSTVLPLACSKLLKELGANHVLLAGLSAFFIAQFAKVLGLTRRLVVVFVLLRLSMCETALWHWRSE